MKGKVPNNRKSVVEIPAKPSLWPYALAAAAAIILAFWAYSPSLNAPFLFDDTNLPYTLPNFKTAPLMIWLRSDLRPVLFFTYYLNAHIGQNEPYSFHVLNVLIHLIGTGLIFLIVRRLLDWPARPLDVRNSAPSKSNANLLAGFAAAIFLLHPVQTEAVAYVAGRSESLSAMFVLMAFGVFVYRKQTAVTWTVVAAILMLFGLALASKQSAIALPALLLLTDFWWNPGFSPRGIRDNWKLYLPMALGALAGVSVFWKLVMTAETAGFGMKDLSWYQYFFTECRAIFVYFAMFLFPVNLNADWDFAISHNILDHGAVVGLLVLIALCAAAWHYRRRFPLASYGFFVFLIMMAPTSSFLPIRDPIAERRLYSAMLGLLLIVVDLLGRVKVERKVLAASCTAVALLAAGVTHARAELWNDSLALWEDTARKSPNKRRVRFQLGMAYFYTNRYDRAVPELEKAGQLEPPDYNLLLDLGLAYNGLNRPGDALSTLRKAALLDPTAHVYTQIAVVYAVGLHWPEALDALDTAEKIDPNFAPTYRYRGNVYLATGRCEDAVREYRHSLTLDPNDEEVFKNLQLAGKCLQSNSH